MTTVVGVRFKDSGKVYHFDPCEVPLAVGDWAIVETVRGPELGRIAAPPMDVPDEQLLGELKPVLRRASQADMNNLAHLQQYLDEALAICAGKIAEHNLPMALVKAEYNFDGTRLTFFFTSDKRVDFRGLVRDLARTFHTRIELRQVGPRDEAKLLGGIGPCGRPLCCSTFLPDFARVSIKMAKDQDLPLNPVKISGVCGRLLCCLSYEHDQYLDIKAELPARGAWVQTTEGPGEVIAVNVVRETVTVELGNGNTIDCTAEQIREVVAQVGAEARARNAEGITPVAQSRSAASEELEADGALLEALEDHPAPPAPFRLEAALAPTNHSKSRTRRTEQGRQPQGDRRRDDQGARHERGATRNPAPEGVGTASRSGVFEQQGERRAPVHQKKRDNRDNGQASQPYPSQGPEAGVPSTTPAPTRRRRRSRGGEGK